MELTISNSKKIKVIQSMLDASADPKTRAWFEAYLKYALPYRGVKTPVVEAIVNEWIKNENIGALSPNIQLDLAIALIHQKYAEDKFAGIICMQKHLIKKVDFNVMADTAESLFKDEVFCDWSTTDWFNVRVLSPLINLHGKKAALRFSTWATSKNLWQKRSSIVCLRSCVSSPQFFPLIRKTIKILSKSNERFIQTGIGWVIADLSKKYPLEAENIVELHFDKISPEVIRRHTKHLRKHKNYLAKKKFDRQ